MIMVQARHVTARGKPFDMTQLRNINSRKPALGNANKNARGDLINKQGVVLKTQEQITAEWAASKRQRESQTKPTNIKSDQLIADLGMQSPPVKQLDVADQHFDVAPVIQETPKPSRRRMTETDK